MNRDRYGNDENRHVCECTAVSPKLLKSGSALSTGDTYFRKNGRAFLPFGTNYFSTDDFQDGFLGGNAFVWVSDTNLKDMMEKTDTKMPCSNKMTLEERGIKGVYESDKFPTPLRPKKDGISLWEASEEAAGEPTR
jgi:hypothetical protein